MAKSMDVVVEVFKLIREMEMNEKINIGSQLLIVKRTTSNWANQMDTLVDRTQEIQKMISGLKRSINNK